MSVELSIVILGPIVHVGWASASCDRHRAQLARAAQSRKGPPDAGEEQPAPRRVVLLHRGQALVHRAVLRVHRHDLGAGRAARLLHDGRAGDERLLVGQGEAPARLERRHRDRQPGEADDGVEDDVGAAGRIDQALLADEHLGAGGDAVADGRVEGGVADDDDGWEELVRLRDEHVGRAVGGERVHPEALRLGANDVERLRADRARGAHQADGAHRLSRGEAP